MCICGYYLLSADKHNTDIIKVMQNQQSTKRFRVALSFPGEHRDYVSKVAEALSQSQQLQKSQIFYDEWYKAELARLSLDNYLQEPKSARIFQNDWKVLVEQ